MIIQFSCIPLLPPFISDQQQLRQNINGYLQEPNHVPLRCEEVEKGDELKERKRIEEKLTAAMLRECWKCGLKYTRQDGCNRQESLLYKS